jgi:hypothetical protein
MNFVSLKKVKLMGNLHVVPTVYCVHMTLLEVLSTLQVHGDPYVGSMVCFGCLILRKITSLFLPSPCVGRLVVVFFFHNPESLYY